MKNSDQRTQLFLKNADNLRDMGGDKGIHRVDRADWGVVPIELPPDLPRPIRNTLDLNDDGRIAGLHESYVALLNLVQMEHDRMSRSGRYASFSTHTAFLNQARRTLGGIDLRDQTIVVAGERLRVESTQPLGGFELFAIKEGLRALPPKLVRRMARGSGQEGPLRIFIGTRAEFKDYAKRKLAEMLRQPDSSELGQLMRQLDEMSQQSCEVFPESCSRIPDPSDQDESIQRQSRSIDVHFELLELEAAAKGVTHVGLYFSDLNVYWYDVALLRELLEKAGGTGEESDAVNAFLPLYFMTHEPVHAADDYLEDHGPSPDIKHFSEGKNFGALCDGMPSDHPICPSVNTSPADPEERSSETLAYSTAFYLAAARFMGAMPSPQLRPILNSNRSLTSPVLSCLPTLNRSHQRFLFGSVPTFNLRLAFHRL